MKFKLLLLLLAIMLSNNSAIAQKLSLSAPVAVENINTEGFTLSWELTQAADEAWVTWSANHAPHAGKTMLGEGQKNFRWVFGEGEPARFYRVQFFAVGGRDTFSTVPTLFSTQSMSSGEVLVYFNHEVDKAVATQTPARYLNRLVDDTLIAYLNRAKETIDIAIYNASASNSLSNIAAALNNAHARGVQVRIVYDSESSNTLMPNVSAQIGKIESKTGFAYGIMHNKFVVIDADAEDPDRALVWTGSTNWSVDQLNGPDENNVIILRDQALARAYKIEFEEMFGSSGAQPNAANSKFGPEKTDNTPHEFNIGGRRVRAYFSPSDGTNAQIIGVINSANADLAFASMIITRNDIANAISTRIIQGVTEVYGITEDSAASQPAPQIWRQLKDALWFDRMTSNNGFSGIMHHKFVLADATASGSDPQLLTGSHNWSNNAELRNDENTLIVHDADIVNQFYQAFSWMFKRYTGRNVSISKGSMPESNWQVFPNPAGAQLFILVPETASTVVSLRLTDLNGRVIKTKQQAATLQPVEFPLEGIADGVYFLVADTQTKKAVFRIVVSP